LSYRFITRITIQEVIPVVMHSFQSLTKLTAKPQRNSNRLSCNKPFFLRSLLVLSLCKLAYIYKKMPIMTELENMSQIVLQCRYFTKNFL